MRRNSVDIDADILADLGHFVAQVFDLVARLLDQRLPATARLGSHAVQPLWVQLVTTVFVDEFAAVDARGVGQLYHALSRCMILRLMP
jgi:hypothetical protein